MKKLGVAIAVTGMVILSGCSPLTNLKAPRISDVNLLKSSKNQRTYQADYDTTFRAAVDALRQVDNGSAKLVKHGEGLIIFNKPNDTGTITANVTKIDERTTHVELLAKDKRRFWLDDTDEETRDAFFAELDERLSSTSAREPNTAASQPEQPLPPEAQPAPRNEVQQDRSLLLAKLRRQLQLGEENGFLDKLSYNDLFILDQRLETLNSIAAEKKELAGTCAACYIDLARLYHDAGQYARSAEALKTAIGVEPDNAVAHCNLGEIYKHLGLFDQAIRELNEAERLNPDLPDTYINLGIIYDDYVVDDQKALGYYKKYLELGGSDDQVAEWIGAIEKGP
jgi:tetratricopeptide (TPR) repeat protein